METVVINASPRTDTGKVASNRYRREGVVPCVLYSKEGNLQFNAQPSELKALLYTPKFKVAEINFNGQTHRCILKEVQTHPVTDQITHLDFLKLIKGTPVKVEVPVTLKGAAVGVKSGGKLVQRIRTVHIKASSENIVPEVYLDVTKLDLGQTMRVRDIIPVSGVEIVNPASTPVVGVEIPRALKGAAAEETKAAAGAPAKK
ncbi:MAG: 50S ribosomal protein L25 [Saprospiraceae bacterium]|nr:50S ribosomal protein L25 [Saprospiraceae bacterium]